jgi:RNA polymerase sigma factor (sigma-70 family)
MDEAHPLQPLETQALAAEATRGRHADRELAARLRHAPPGAGEIRAGRLHALADRGAPDRELLAAARAGDEDARARLVEAHLPLIAALSRRYAGAPHIERLELIQEGVAGLLQALERFDPSSGTPFWAYARPTVQRAMQRLMTELGDAVVLPERARRRLSRLRTAEDELMREHRRMPSRHEIVERSGIDREDAERVLAGTSPPRSFQEPIIAEDGGVIGSFGDLVDDPRAQDAYERVLDRIETQELLPLLSVLSARERSVLRARFGLDGAPQSHREIAERLGVSVSRVRDIERRALAKLRSSAAAADRAATARPGSS